MEDEITGPSEMRHIFNAFAIPHNEHRYPTVGDWAVGDDGTVDIRVSMMHDRRYEELVAIHELIEATLCKYRNIKEEVVNEFDIAYEEAREKGSIAPCGCMLTENSEPGDDIHAPYYTEHQLATSVERMLAAELHVSWNAYEGTIEGLFDEPAPAEVASQQEEATDANTQEA